MSDWFLVVVQVLRLGPLFEGSVGFSNRFQGAKNRFSLAQRVENRRSSFSLHLLRIHSSQKKFQSVRDIHPRSAGEIYEILPICPKGERSTKSHLAQNRRLSLFAPSLLSLLHPALFFVCFPPILDSLRQLADKQGTSVNPLLDSVEIGSRGGEQEAKKLVLSPRSALFCLEIERFPLLLFGQSSCASCSKVSEKYQPTFLRSFFKAKKWAFSRVFPPRRWI